MKKILPSKIQALMGVACIIFTLSGCNSNSSSNQANNGTNQTNAMMQIHPSYYLSGEDSLNVTGDTLHVSTGNNRFTLKDTCLYVAIAGKLTSIDSLDDLADTLYLRSLYDTAYKKNSGGHFVTVLQIKYGLHNHKIKLYYKPLCLTRDSISTGTSTRYGYYSNHNKFDSNYYYYTGAGFVRAPYKNQFLKDSLNYIDSIRIRHHLSNPTPGYFYTPDNDTGDVHSIIYSFQEVYSLIKNNSGSHYVKVSNIGQKVVVQVNGVNVKFYKHSVMMGPTSLEPGGRTAGQGSGTYYNVYADLGNLCPPNCVELQYQLK